VTCLNCRDNGRDAAASCAHAPSVQVCLLCPAVAVADCLCVPCGAKLAAAKLWEKDPIAFKAAVRLAELPLETFAVDNRERMAALRIISTEREAHDFLAALESARAKRLEEEARKNRGKDL